MRHGAYCRTRSFPTKCKRCGAPVLYWECAHGCKFFMEYPIYGRGQRHVCKTVSRKKNTAIATHGELLTQKIERITFQCPICDKIFQKESDLSSHVIKMRKQDDFHEALFQKQIYCIEFEDKDENFGEDKESTSNYNTATNSIEWSKYQTKHEYFTMNERYYLKKKKPSSEDPTTN